MNPKIQKLISLILIFFSIFQSANASYFTSAQNGNWNSSSTWNGGVVPSDGDSVLINHNIIVTANQTVGTGAATAINIGNSGTLEINQNIVLTVKGNILASGNITLQAGAQLQMNTAAPSFIQLTPGNTIAYLQVNGTASQHCQVKAIGAGHTRITDNDESGGGRVIATFCDFQRLGGDPDFRALKYKMISSGEHYSFTDCTFDQCSQIKHDGDFDVPSGAYLEFIRCKWTNSVVKTNLGQYEEWNILETWSNYGATGKLINCDFDKRVALHWPKDYEIEDCVFRDGIHKYTGEWWGGIFKSFKRNFIRWNGVGSNPGFEYGNTLEDCIFIIDEPSGWNPHFGNIAAGTGEVLINGCIFWWTGTASNADGDGFFIDAADSGTREDNTVTFSRCIYLPNANGPDGVNNISCTGFTILTTSYNKQVVFKRNTVYSGNGSGGINLGETYDATTGDVNYVKSNLFVGDINYQGMKVNDKGNCQTDVFLADSVDFNGSYRVQDGSLYGNGSGKGYDNFAFSGSNVVGDDDVDNQIPMFVDPNRTPATWTPSGTLDATMDWLSPDGGHTMQQLSDYIREGFRPQNVAYKNAGDPNDGSPDIGAVNITVTINIPPSVTLTEPTDGATFWYGENIVMKATASDSDGSIIKVEFYSGNTKLGEDDTAPYEFNWSDAPTGNHNLKAIAIDNDNDSTSSNISNITIVKDSPPLTWKHSGLGGGGGMFSPSISPFDKQEVYIASDMSGIYHSTDACDSWDILDFRQIRANIESKINFTSSPDTLYSIGNYDWPDYRRPVISIDSGETWSGLSGDSTNAETYYLFADPDSTTRILLSSYDKLYFSNDAGSSFTMVYTSSDLYVGGVFWDGNDIFVGCIDGMLVSHNNGSSFALENFNDDIPADYGMLSLTGSKKNGQVRMFCVARPKSSIWPGINPVEYWSNEADVFRLNYTGAGGSGWTRQNSGINADAFPFFVVMNAYETDTVYMAGSTEWPEYNMVYKSTDGGDNWTNTFQTTNNQNIKTGWMGEGGDLNWGWAGSTLGISICPNDLNTIVITDWGFAHTSTDGGNSWQQIYVPAAESNPAGSQTPQGLDYHSNGLEITSSWWLTWSDENKIFASYTDFTGIKSEDAGQRWNLNYSGNDYNSTYQVVKRPDNGKLFAAVSSVHDLYQSNYLEDSRIDSGTGEILQSTDFGHTWTTLYDFGHPVIWIALSPNDPDKMYASVVHSTSGGIFYSSNGGTSWTKLNNPPRTEGHPFNIRVLGIDTLVCTYSGRIDANGDFTESSGVFYSTDNGTTWSDVSHPDMYRWTKDIIIDSHDPNQNTWYACVFSHWGHYPNEVGGVFRTTDRGVNWTRLNNLYRVNSLTIHPDFEDICYITTETQGLWYSYNFSNSSPAITQLDYPFAQPMRLFFNPYNHNEVWVTSFGTGTMKGMTKLGRTYYVNTSGNNSNDGLSEANAWRTISYAASSSSPVAPGDTVYIKAGDYGNENVVFETNGTATNRITFEGYQTEPGDNPNLEWEYGDSFDASVMPLLDGGDRTTGEAIILWSRECITVKNIQIKNYQVGLDAWDGHNLKVENIITMNFGDINEEYDGRGIVFGSLASNNILENCSVLNAAAEGISISGDNHHLTNCRVYADDNSTGYKSATDYYIHVDGNNNVIEDCYVERVGNLDHGGHGIDLKTYCENNQILNCVSKGMSDDGFELRHRGVIYNTMENCTAINCGLVGVRDGASHNLIKNCKTINSTWNGVNFYDTSEDDGAQYTGRYNVFENCIFQNPAEAMISFMYYDQISIADSNTFINCVFDGGDYLFTCDRENNANKMVNCIVTNVQNYYRTAYNQSASYPLNFDFEYSDFYNNGFAAPSGTNIMTYNPEFVDLANYDYHLQSSSQCIDSGTFNEAPSEDFDGIPRPLLSGIDLGVYENGLYWTGNVNHDWHTSGNWSTGQVPNTTDKVTIPSPDFYKFYPEVNSNAQIKALYLNEEGKIIIKDNVVFDVVE